MEKNNNQYIWSVKNPYGHDVILKEDTYNSHIIADHSKADADFRKKMADTIPQIVKCPSYIIKDKEHDDRYQYISAAKIPIDDNKSKIKLITTIIETNRNPHEVVTWIAKRGFDINEGDVVYDANKNILR